MRLVQVGLALGVLVAASACGSNDGSTIAPTTSPLTTAPGTEPSIVPPTTTPTTTSNPITTSTTSPPDTSGVPTSPPSSPSTTAPAPSTSTTVPAAFVDVRVYFLREERLVIAHRQVPAPAVLRGALTELLAGPTRAERAAGLSSAVPVGTELLGVDIDVDVGGTGGAATVDLGNMYGAGGGSLSMFARVAQVVFTATQFPNVDRVVFRMDGEPIEFLGGEGLILTDPQTRAMVDRTMSGSVIIDVPARGATVTSPFTVTGEGDVYEGQFPIEVWAGGEQIGGVAPVTAGAWGTWADFEVTITLEAGPGPIELVAYDEGGCGTDPECPPIVKTLVPLTFAG